MGNALKKEVPVFNQELVEKFTPMINKMIATRVHNFNSSDVCYEKEDVFQECLIHLHTATKDFSPDRGMKFSSYVYLLLESRMSNFRNKIARRNRNGTVSMSSMGNGWGIVGGSEEISQYEKSSFSKKYKELVGELNDSNDKLNQILEMHRVFDKLDGIKKLLFQEYYILGRSVKEIQQVYPQIKYHTIRRQMKFVENIVKTLVK